MEVKLIKQIFDQQKKILVKLDFLETFCALFCLLLVISSFLMVRGNEIIVSALIVCVILHQIVLWQRRKTISATIQLLENDIKFWESQKLKYKQLKKEITEKIREKKNWIGKQIFDLEIMEREALKIDDSDWLSKKILSIEEEILQTKCWIEQFKKLG